MESILKYDESRGERPYEFYVTDEPLNDKGTIMKILSVKRADGLIEAAMVFQTKMRKDFEAWQGTKDEFARWVEGIARVMKEDFDVELVRTEEGEDAVASWKVNGV